MWPQQQTDEYFYYNPSDCDFVIEQTKELWHHWPPHRADPKEV